MDHEKNMDNNSTGPFVWKDTYVILAECNNYTTLAHPMEPDLIGKILLNLIDKKGNLFLKNFVKKQNTYMEAGPSTGGQNQGRIKRKYSEKLRSL